MPDDTRPLDDAHVDELGDQICELAAHIAAATYRLLRLLAAFDRRTGWAGWGLKSCAHWLNWKCGLSLRTAREHIRVAHTLEELPLIANAFSRGELSYSKVRALTRFATPATEEDLLVFARHGTASHMEKLARSYVRCVSTADAQRRHERRHLTWRYQSDGSVELSARLEPEEAAIVIEALEKITAELRVCNRVPDSASDGSAEPPRDRVDASAELARRELAGDSRRSSSGDRYLVMVHVDESGLHGDDDGACHINDGSCLAPETARRILCDGAYVATRGGAPLDLGRKKRTISTAQRRGLVLTIGVG